MAWRACQRFLDSTPGSLDLAGLVNGCKSDLNQQLAWFRSCLSKEQPGLWPGSCPPSAQSPSVIPREGALTLPQAGLRFPSHGSSCPPALRLNVQLPSLSNSPHPPERSRCTCSLPPLLPELSLASRMAPPSHSSTRLPQPPLWWLCPRQASYPSGASPSPALEILKLKSGKDTSVLSNTWASHEHVSTCSLWWPKLHLLTVFAEEGFLVSPCSSWELCIQLGISFPFFLAFHVSSFLSYL